MRLLLNFLSFQNAGILPGFLSLFCKISKLDSKTAFLATIRAVRYFGVIHFLGHIFLLSIVQATGSAFQPYALDVISSRTFHARFALSPVLARRYIIKTSHDTPRVTIILDNHLLAVDFPTSRAEALKLSLY